MGLLEPPDEGEMKLLGKGVHRLNDNEKSNLRLNWKAIFRSYFFSPPFFFVT